MDNCSKKCLCPLCLQPILLDLQVQLLECVQQNPLKMSALDEYTSSAIKIHELKTDPFTVHSRQRGDVSDDIKIWTAFKLGDDQAYEIMFRKHYQLLLNYGLKFNNSEEDVKDYIQQLFTKLWESRERLGKNNSIRSYLLASLRRMILKGAKQKFNFLCLNNVASSFHMRLSVENKYLRKQDEKDQAAFMSKLVDSLPKRQKEAVYLKYYADHSFSEIAEIMGITTRVVYKLIYKALDKLSVKIKENKQIKDNLT